MGLDWLDKDERRRIADDDETLLLIGEIYRDLRVPVPFKRSVGQWGGYHLYPYVGQLVHYDSVNRKHPGHPLGRPHVERYLYRGGGALAYELLRRDADGERLDRVRGGLADLVADSDRPIGILSSLLATADADKPEGATVDNTVPDWNPALETNWSELLRSGTDDILAGSLMRPKKVEHLMHWVPYCMARHQLELAHRELGHEQRAFPVDVSVGGTLRRESRRAFDRHRRYVYEALRQRAARFASSEQTDEHDRPVYLDLIDESSSQKWNTGSGDFYAFTLAVIGGINHNTGPRHYTIKLPLLEAIVAATVEGPEGVPFSEFCFDILYKRLGLIVDQRSGADSEITMWIDNGLLKRNEEGLSRLLAALGVMTALSDATRYVGRVE